MVSVRRVSFTLVVCLAACGGPAPAKPVEKPYVPGPAIPEGQGWMCIAEVANKAHQTCFRGDKCMSMLPMLRESHDTVGTGTCVEVPLAWCMVYRYNDIDQSVCLDNKPACDKLEKVFRENPEHQAVASCIEHD